VRNYLDAWREAYGVGERDVSVVITLYARTTPLGLQDAMWAKYRLGAALSLSDSTTSAPLIRNYFAHPQPGDPVADGTPESSMESLQRRGVVFLLCNNALKRWSGRLEKQGLGGHRGRDSCRSDRARFAGRRDRTGCAGRDDQGARARLQLRA